jgi:LacI family transcriptional regulator
MATIKDVAALAKVSTATVSYVINDTKPVQEATAQRVLAAMDELGYHPDARAQSLRRRKTHLIAVIVPDIAQPFYAKAVRGIEDSAFSMGYTTIVCNTQEEPEREASYTSLLLGRAVDGAIVAPASSGSNAVLERVDTEATPIVLVDRLNANINVDSVLSNHEEGAYIGTKHLLDRGYNHIAAVLGSPAASSTIERLAGHTKALLEHGVEIDESLIYWGRHRLVDGQRAASYFMSLDQKPDAVFVMGDMMAVGLLQELKRQRIEVGEDLGVVSFGDIELAPLTSPPLTAVAEFPYQIGVEACEMLLGRVNKGNAAGTPRIHRVAVELRERESA